MCIACVWRCCARPCNCRLLVQAFGKLIDNATTMGALENEQRELDFKCETLTQKISERSIGKIKEDIRQVQVENAALQAKLAAAL
jgi:hypothetical protein